MDVYASFLCCLRHKFFYRFLSKQRNTLRFLHCKNIKEGIFAQNSLDFSNWFIQQLDFNPLNEGIS